MQRHPIDTCLSIYFQHFYNLDPYANDLDSLAHYYGEYLRIAAHWRAVLPKTALLEVPYEALVDDQEGWTRRMLEFIGLPWDARCLEFHRAERVVITASKWQVRQKNPFLGGRPLWKLSEIPRAVAAAVERCPGSILGEGTMTIRRHFDLVRRLREMSGVGNLTAVDTFRVGCIGAIDAHLLRGAVAAIGDALTDMGVRRFG